MNTDKKQKEKFSNSKTSSFGADSAARCSEQIELKAVSIFATGVSHNFNNIMGGVKGAVDVLKRYAPDNPVVVRCFEVIEQSLSQGQALTKKMACLQTQELNSRKILKEDLSQIVTSVVEVQQQLVGKRISFYLNLPGQLPIIKADTQNVIDIVTSVIKNSIESIAAEGSISLEVRPSSENKGVILEVVDNGCGMSAEVLSRAQEPFYSTKHMDHENGISTVGNGLGLWNVYNLTRMLGGKISMQSSPGEGTKVEIMFPAEHTQS